LENYLHEQISLKRSPTKHSFVCIDLSGFFVSFFYLCKGQEAVLSQPVLAAYSIKQDGEGGAHQAAQGRQLPVLHVAAGIKIGSVTILNSKNLYCFNYKYLVAKIILLKFLI
jgi:hypothetical protein